MPRMGRRRTKGNSQLPPRLHWKNGAYYYVTSGKPRRWIRLSRDLKTARLEWARLEDGQPATGSVAQMIRHYQERRFADLAPRTREDRARYLERLVAVFGQMRPDEIEPHHIGRYLDDHPAPVAANREIATFSTVYTHAMRVGLASRNPCAGVSRNRESSRDRYVTDAEFLAVKPLAGEWLAAVMDFAYMTGMRQGDMLALRRADLSDQGIPLRQSKTRQRQLMEWTGALRDAVSRINRARPVAGLNLVCTRRGQPYTASGFKALWQRLQRRAIREGVIRERFTWHDIRAKCLTDAEEGGLDPQRLAGHTTRKQTETYLRSRRTVRVQPWDPTGEP